MSRALQWAATGLVLLCALAGCGGHSAAPTPPPPPPPTPAAPVTYSNEIPTTNLGPILEAHLRGVGLMEQYAYGDAVKQFRKVHELAPGWIPGSINLAIALLNDVGKSSDAAKKSGGSASTDNFGEALTLLDDVLVHDRDNLHARYCKGIIFESVGRTAEAHDEFLVVVERDPSDAHAWLHLGLTLVDPDRREFPAGPKQAAELIDLYTKALERDPYLVPAVFKLQQAYGWAGKRDKQKELNTLWQRLDPLQSVTGSGDSAQTIYGEMGKYASIIGLGASQKGPSDLVPPRFDPPAPVQVKLPEGERWAKASDFKGKHAFLGRVRNRFGQAVVALDANGDGKLDLYLAAAVAGPKGVRDVLLINRGDGQFEDATAALGLPADRASLGVAAGDFDADRRIDLYLTGVGDNRLYRNVGDKGFEDITQSAGVAGPAAVTLTARWLDLDQDGDLDLYLINYTDAGHEADAFGSKTPPGIANTAFRNDGKPSPVERRPEASLAPAATAPADLKTDQGLSIKFTAWPDAPDLLGGDQPHTGIAALDVDGDRDLDLVLTADGQRAMLVLNDRLGRFHAVQLDRPELADPSSGLLVTDLNKDDLPDLVALCPEAKVEPWRNEIDTHKEKPAYSFAIWPTDARRWAAGLVADLDLDGALDLVGFSREAKSPTWVRNEGTRIVTRPLGLGPDTGSATGAITGLTLADFLGDPLPDLVLVRDGEGPRIAKNRGNGHHWLALDLSGRWKAGKDHMRTNPPGLGTRIWLQAPGLDVSYDHTTTEAGLSQSVAPVVIGLGQKESAALLRLLWPDGVMQCELNQPGDQLVRLPEFNRKPDSCPVLFTWNGERFVCIGDFLGGGGLGYLISPGVYNQPDRDEALAIAPEQLQAASGFYRIAITEPMDEVSYLDLLTLDVIDRPPGVSTAPDERFAPTGPRPTGRLLAWKTTIEPERATDLTGRDVTETLRSWDRRTVDGFRRLGDFIGYTEEHGIVLDFGDRLAQLKPETKVILCLAGWVEYPHSSTNYAASTAGLALNPPILERQEADGSWTVIDPHPGYPAGMPRLSTLEVTGKLCGPRCVIRLRTNMELYWDQAFVAIEEPADLKVTSLPVHCAKLAYRGYTREISPDGRAPLLYDYDYVDPAPLARLDGKLTRLGDVTELLTSDDDRLCLVGPGDEVKVEFDARNLPALPAGWTRAYILRTVGYCKDANPFTAASDTIGPQPWRGMRDYPFGPEGQRPQDPAYQKYLRDYQTRPAGAR